MASGYVNLPAFRAPGPIDFSGLNQGIEALGQRLEKNRLLDQNKQIGSAIQSGDYGAGAKAAFGYGDLNTGLQLQQAQRDIQNAQYQRQRQAAQDRRAAAGESRAAQTHELTMQKTRDDLRANLITRTAGIAERIRNETDPQRKATLMNSFVNAHPRLKAQFDAYNLDMANPDPVLDMIISEARGLSGADASYGTTPQYYTDAEGNLRVGQLSNKGGFRPVEVPGMIRPTLQFQNTGTAIVPLSRQTGKQTAPAIQKDIAGEASAKEIGKQQGEAQTKLPAIETATNRVLKAIDTLDKSPMRKSFTGYSGYLPNLSPEANDYQAILNQVAGNIFLQAFNDLRGGGAITEAEGQKATASLSRLGQVAPSDQGYQAALDDTRKVMREILSNARKRAGLTNQSSPEISDPLGIR